MIEYTIPDAATFHQEENGVKWFSLHKGGNIIHYMMFNQRVLMGSWCGPRRIFFALTMMSQEELKRISSDTHDACMGAINQMIRSV